MNLIDNPPPQSKNKTGWLWSEETDPAIYDQTIDWPKISIVTPSYNQGEFIEETIRSILLQNYPNLEYIIIDGGSTDNTVDIIKKYEKYITYWVSEPDEGHGDALNKGFAKTTGEIMAWLNSDDMYYPWTFKTIVEIFHTFKDVKWITGIPTAYDKQGRTFKAVYTYKNIYSFLLGNYAWIQQESTFWKRDLWETSGEKINTNYKFMVDGELWTRFFLHQELWHVNIFLGGYRIHDTNRALLNPKAISEEMKKAINDLKKNCTFENIKISKELKNIKNTQKKRFLKLLPFIFYEKLINYITIKKISKLKKRFRMNFDYNIIIQKNGSWIKAVKPFITDK